MRVKLVIPIAAMGITFPGAVLSPGLAFAESAQYFTTPWGTRCQITATNVACDTCEPGLLLDTAAGAADCGKGSQSDVLIVNTAGVQQNSSTPGILGPTPNAQQITAGQTFHANGWTITMGSLGVQFTNDATNHGMAVAPQNYKFY